MSRYSRKIVVPFTPEQMQLLVGDIRSYPDFIPWIKSMRVTQESQSEEFWSGRAEAAIGFKGFSERFTTDVTSNQKSELVRVKLVKGPFRRLNNQWRFAENPEGCQIDFDIDFEFSNPVLHMLFKANHAAAVTAIMGAFVKEAHVRYQTTDRST